VPASRIRRLVTAAALLLALAAAGVGAAAAAERPTRATTGQVFGVTTAGLPKDTSGLDSLASALGRRPGLVMWYSAWGDGLPFPAEAAARVAATGAVPVITWEPWDAAQGTDQPAYALDRIAAGDFTAYETAWARQIKGYGGPVGLRFAHEMNGDWYPWSARTNGNTARDYVRAWRQVRSVFTRENVTNVTWTWSPNVPSPGTSRMASLYPGDAYVDQVALDGYNWGPLKGGRWTSFEEVFAAGIKEIGRVSGKPLFVGEVGSTEAGGDKAAWVADMFATLQAHPEVRGFTWFDHRTQTDWRIDSSPATFAAFQAGLATY
jgi:Glycosyl hydrolase family 26